MVISLGYRQAINCNHYYFPVVLAEILAFVFSASFSSEGGSIQCHSNRSFEEYGMPTAL